MCGVESRDHRRCLACLPFSWRRRRRGTRLSGVHQEATPPKDRNRMTLTFLNHRACSNGGNSRRLRRGSGDTLPYNHPLSAHKVFPPGGRPSAPLHAAHVSCAVLRVVFAGASAPCFPPPLFAHTGCSPWLCFPRTLCVLFPPLPPPPLAYLITWMNGRVSRHPHPPTTYHTSPHTLVLF